MESKLEKSFHSFFKKISKLSNKNLNELELITLTSSTNFLYNPILKAQKHRVNDSSFLAKFKKLIIFTRDIAYIFLSIPGLFKLLYVKDISIVWSGDFYDESTGGDFRLGNFFKHAYTKKLIFIEFITTSQLGLLHSLNLFTKRKRAVIYIDSFVRVIKFLSRFKINLSNFCDFGSFDKFIIEDNFKNILATEKLLNTRLFSNIKNVFIWHISSKTSGIFFWAKKNNIKTIGIMHGLPFKEYVYSETMPGLKFKENFKIDYFGVWSNYWLDYYEKNTSMIDNLEISGPLRKKNKFVKSSGENFLLLIEPLLDVSELANYEKFFKKYYDKFSLKVRSDFKAEHLDKYFKLFPFLKKCKIIKNNMDDVLSTNEYKFCIATHTTGIIDCLNYGLFPLVLNTETWGNYLNLDEDFIFHNSSEIISFLSEENINHNKINFLADKFSKSGDGSEWIINKLLES